MQWISIVRFLANRADHNQVALSILTDDGRPGRLNQLVAGDHALPFLDTPGAEAVLTLPAFLCINNDHLAYAANEMRVKLLLAHRGLLRTLLHGCILLGDTAESCGIELNAYFFTNRFAHCHDLVDLLVI